MDKSSGVGAGEGGSRGMMSGGSGKAIVAFSEDMMLSKKLARLMTLEPMSREDLLTPRSGGSGSGLVECRTSSRPHTRTTVALNTHTNPQNRMV